MINLRLFHITVAYLLLPFMIFGQAPIHQQLETIKGIKVKEITHPEFQHCFEVQVEQTLDHFDPNSKTFHQKVILGFNNVLAPVVMFTEGYALGQITKPDFIKECNVIYVEHRYFGKSRPDSLNWNFLTIKQAAYDLHHIRELFGKLFKGKWMTSGASKSGQTALAYKMYFPTDADATVAYVTPVKRSLNDKRINEHLKALLKSECGKRVTAFQKFILRNRTEMLQEFEKYSEEKKYTFQKTGL